MQEISRLGFIFAIVILILAGFVTLLNHLGFAINLISLSFLILVISVISYIYQIENED